MGKYMCGAENRHLGRRKLTMPVFTLLHNPGGQEVIPLPEPLSALLFQETQNETLCFST